MKSINYIFAFLFVFVELIFSNVRVTPTKIFLDYPKRSTTIELVNTQNIEVDVWIDCKYGYTATDDSNNFVVITPEKLSADDRSAIEWIKIYPSKFVLQPYEKRNVRLIVNPPMDLDDGEYWSRIIVSSKKIGKVLDIKKSVSGAVVGFEVQHQQSLPFHFRKGKISTDISLITEPKFEIQSKKLFFKLNLNRMGNSSYWGIINFIISDKNNKPIKKEWQPLVVYKQIKKDFVVDLKELTPGEYNLNVSIETRRFDEVTKYVIKAEPKNWKYNFRLQ